MDLNRAEIGLQHGPKTIRCYGPGKDSIVLYFMHKVIFQLGLNFLYIVKSTFGKGEKWLNRILGSLFPIIPTVVPPPVRHCKPNLLKKAELHCALLVRRKILVLPLEPYFFGPTIMIQTINHV